MGTVRSPKIHDGVDWGLYQMPVVQTLTNFPRLCFSFPLTGVELSKLDFRCSVGSGFPAYSPKQQLVMEPIVYCYLKSMP